METVSLVLTWLADNWEAIGAAAAAIVAITPTDHDNTVVDRVRNLGRKLLAVFRPR